MAKLVWNNPAQPNFQMYKQPEHDPTPEQIVTEEEAEVGEPGGTKKALSGFGRKNDLKRAKNEKEEKEGNSNCGEYGHVYLSLP